MPAEQTNIKVAVRVRPYNRRELEQNQRCVVKVLDPTTLLFDPDEEDDEFFFQGAKQHYRDITKRVNKKISMEFDRVFDTDANNMQIFTECTLPLVDSVLNGYNCSVFVYGATGAGKTFTMLGNESCLGLTFLTMRDLFEKIKIKSSTHKFDVGVSYLEVYNEHVMNLLTKTGPLKLREDSNGVVVSGLVLKPIYSAEGLLELLALGNSHRTQHPTDANSESSRSHAIFQVHIRMTDLKTDTKRTVKLSMIDLAGSERAASTKGIGLRFKEGASINKSLLALGNCINKLADGLKHIPYRDSNLTRILKDSLGGNCQTLMVANVSMSSLTYEDTYNTLKYASRAKKIRTTLRQNVLKSNMPKDFYVKKVTECLSENDRLKESYKTLEAKFSQLQKSATASRAYDENELKPWYSKIDAVYSVVIKTQEYVIGTQSKIKNLNLRTKLQENTKNFAKKLSINESDVQESFLSSVSYLNKQVEKQKLELVSWRQKLQDAYKDLETLKKEIKGSKYADILQIYLKSKDLEIRSSKQNININHISGINSELMRDSSRLYNVLNMACEVLQESYERLSEENKLGANLQSNFEQLQRHMTSSHSVHFKDKLKKDSDEELDFDVMDAALLGKRAHAGDSGMSLSSTAFYQRNKRLNFESDLDLGLEIAEDTDSDGCSGSKGTVNGVFKMPTARMHKLNETQVLSSAEDEYSTTFDSSSSSTITVNANKVLQKQVLISNILSEKITHVPANKDHMKHVLLKSNNFTHQGLLRTVAAGVQKENKKYSPVRVRKSPRNGPSKALPSTATLMRKQTKRTVGNSNLEIPVRINRAASFRAKK